MDEAGPETGDGRRPDAARRRAGRIGLAIRVAFLVALVGGVTYGIHTLQQRQDADRLWHQQHDLVKAPEGSCLTREPGSTAAGRTSYDRADCAAADAAFVVLHRDRDPTDRCAAVIGSVASVSLSDGDVAPPANDTVHLCLGRKGADPAQAIQTVIAGRCVRVLGDSATPSPCTDSGAAKVLKVARDVDHTTINDLNLRSSVIAVCGDSLARSTDSLFTWRLARSGAPERFYSWDIVLCLTKPAA